MYQTRDEQYAAEIAAKDEEYDRFQQISDDYRLDELSEKTGEDGIALLSDHE